MSAFTPEPTSKEKAAEKAKENKPVFADKEAMQAQVRLALIKPQYNVNDYYWNEGCTQRIAKHYLFEHITFIVIIMNAIWIAVDIDQNDAATLLDAHPLFQIAEHSFCAYFVLELTIRFLAFRKKKNCLRDMWFNIDLVLVGLMVAETWILTGIMYYLGQSNSSVLGNVSIFRILKMAKILRVSRMARLLHAIPELLIVLKGLGMAARSVGLFFVLWLIIIYVFAVVFRQLTDGAPIGGHYFKSVPEAMNTLLLRGIFPDSAEFVNDLGSANPFLWPIIIFFILLAAMTLMYMLIGVLVEIVAVIASNEKEGLTVIALSSQLRVAWEALGRDSENEAVTKDDFQRLLVDPEIVRIAHDVGVDVFMIVDMTDILFEELHKEEKEMTFENFVELMLKMRGANAATVRDMSESLKMTLSAVHKGIEEIANNVGEEFTILRGQLQAQADQSIRMTQHHMAMMAAQDDSDDENPVPQDTLDSPIEGEENEPKSP